MRTLEVLVKRERVGERKQWRGGGKGEVEIQRESDGGVVGVRNRRGDAYSSGSPMGR